MPIGKAWQFQKKGGNDMDNSKKAKEIKKIMGGIMQFRNMNSPSGNPVANQFVVSANEFTGFKSYNSIIAIKYDGQIYLDTTDWDYSVTTGKYRNIFLGEGIRETRKKIKNGTYVLADLN